MNLDDLNREVEDKAVEYLNATRLNDLEEKALNQLERSASNGYVRLHKLEFSALLNSVRGLHRKVRQQVADLTRERDAAVKTYVIQREYEEVNTRLEEQVRRLTDALPIIRREIADCLGGRGPNSAVWSNAPYDKGWCNGLTAALTAFDHAAKQALAQASEENHG